MCWQASSFLFISEAAHRDGGTSINLIPIFMYKVSSCSNRYCCISWEILMLFFTSVDSRVRCYCMQRDPLVDHTYTRGLGAVSGRKASIEFVCRSSSVVRLGFDLIQAVVPIRATDRIQQRQRKESSCCLFSSKCWQISSGVRVSRGWPGLFRLQQTLASLKSAAECTPSFDWAGWLKSTQKEK